MRMRARLTHTYVIPCRTNTPVVNGSSVTACASEVTFSLARTVRANRKVSLHACRINSEDAWAPSIVHCRWVGGVAVCSVPGTHRLHLLRSLEVLAHPLTKDVQV